MICARARTRACKKAAYSFCRALLVRIYNGAALEDTFPVSWSPRTTGDPLITIYLIPTEELRSLTLRYLVSAALTSNDYRGTGVNSVLQ